MARHSLGLHSNGGGGLPGLAPIVPVAPAPLASRIGARDGVPEVDTAGAAAEIVPRDEASVDDLIARLRANPPRPRPARRLNFKDDPIGAISFALREVGAALQGKPLPSEKIAKEEAAQQLLELKRFQVGLDALGEFTKLPTNQRAAAAAGFNKSFGDFLGLDFAELAPTVGLEDVLAFAKGIDPGILTPLSGDPEKLRDTLLDKSKRSVLEEASDAKNLRPAMRKIIAGVEQVSGRLGKEDKAALAGKRFTMQDLNRLAEPLGLNRSELAALDRNQATAFPQLAEATGLQFTSEGALQKAAERPSLERVGAEAQAKARGKAAGTPQDRTTDLVDFASGKAVLKTEASSSVRGAVASLFGGTFDPISQTIKGLDKGASRRALAVQAEAERLLLEQTEVTPAAAVQSALKTIEARGSGENISLPSSAEVQAMDVEKVRQLVESLPPETEISPALAAAITKKLTGQQ